MIRLVIGQNTIGKSLYLINESKKYKLSEIETNFFSDGILSDRIEYDHTRTEILRNLLDADEVITDTTLLGFKNPDIVCSEAFIKLFSLLCRNKQIFFLDEPDKMLRLNEKILFINFLAQAENTFEDIYIVTHNEQMLSLPKRKLYTVTMDKNTSKLQLTEVGEDKKYEIID